MMIRLHNLLFFAMLVAMPEVAHAQWGNLSGQFIYGGEGTQVPAAAKIVPTKDEQVCGQHQLYDESLVVNAENRGIQNVLVWLYTAPNAAKPKVHPDYDETAKDTVKIDNTGCRFEPRVVALRTTQTFEIGNSDPVGHNTKVTTITNTPINPIVPARSTIEQLFPAPERFPSPVECSIHPWMKGYVLIQDHPFMAVSDKDGKFEIKNLPAGEWTFIVWQEGVGFLPGAQVNGKPQVWRRGRMTVKIADGKTTELGKIIVDPAVLEKK